MLLLFICRNLDILCMVNIVNQEIKTHNSGLSLTTAIFIE